jgi:hypothetical protein
MNLYRHANELYALVILDASLSTAIQFVIGHKPTTALDKDSENHKLKKYECYMLQLRRLLHLTVNRIYLFNTNPAMSAGLYPMN